MVFAKVFSAQHKGLTAEFVSVEADVVESSFSFLIVGLPDKSVEEAKERVDTALKNSKLPHPKTNKQKTTISLLPSSVKKRGGIFDLPIAISFLLAKEYLDFNTKDKLFLGELSLSGKISGVVGILPILIEAKKKGFKEVYIPKSNTKEASLISGIDIYPVSSLSELVAHFKQKKLIKKIRQQKLKRVRQEAEIYLDDIVGQEHAKYALKIAAAGGHNIAFYGPPGVGKTMLAKALKNLLPVLSLDEIIEVSSIYSVAGLLGGGVVVSPPFRDPHHSSSFVSVIGGGAEIKPGEVSLAHKGVLFFDELPEYEPRTINALRQPLEQQYVVISRAKETVKFPADFLFVAAFNPCPCGYYGTDKCICMPHQIKRYQSKISGPIADRIDIWVKLDKISFKKITQHKTLDTLQHTKAQKQIQIARHTQYKRQNKLNAKLSAKQIGNMQLTDMQKQILNKAYDNLGLSMRALHKIIKVAQTIADIESDGKIQDKDILQAIGYREFNMSY